VAGAINLLKILPMESIIHQLGHLDIFPVIVNSISALTKPFVHSFQSIVPTFLPYIKSLISNEPGLVGGMIIVLLSYLFVVLVEKTKKERVVVTNGKPSTTYREDFPSGMNIEKRL
jgi:hypothetical protein